MIISLIISLILWLALYLKIHRFIDHFLYIENEFNKLNKLIRNSFLDLDRKIPDAPHTYQKCDNCGHMPSLKPLTVDEEKDTTIWVKCPKCDEFDIILRDNARSWQCLGCFIKKGDKDVI